MEARPSDSSVQTMIVWLHDCMVLHFIQNKKQNPPVLPSLPLSSFHTLTLATVLDVLESGNCFFCLQPFLWTFTWQEMRWERLRRTLCTVVLISHEDTRKPKKMQSCLLFGESSAVVGYVWDYWCGKVESTVREGNEHGVSGLVSFTCSLLTRWLWLYSAPR